MGNFKLLDAWKKSMQMVVQVYRASQCFPKDEMYGLTSQLRRAAVSVPSNIAEGQGRLSRGEFQQFLGNAKGSLQEVETQILIARELGYIDESQVTDLMSTVHETGRILNGLLFAIRSGKQTPKAENQQPATDN